MVNHSKGPCSVHFEQCLKMLIISGNSDSDIHQVQYSHSVPRGLVLQGEVQNQATGNYNYEPGDVMALWRKLEWESLDEDRP